MSSDLKSDIQRGREVASSEHHLTWTGVFLGGLGGLLLVCMMGLTVFDVIGRYLFNAPIVGATELTELLLCAVIFLGLGAVSLAEEHVTVDLLTDKFPDAIQPLRQGIIGIFSGVMLLVVAWRIWTYADQIGGYGGQTTNLHIPIAPLGYFCATCAVFGAVITAALPFKRLLSSAKA